jgi:hypothetical protein
MGLLDHFLAGLGLLLLLRHGLRQVNNLVLSALFGGDDESFFACKILSTVVFRADGWVNCPFLVFRILNGYLLRICSSNDCVKVDLLKLGRVLADGFAHHLKIDWFSSFYFTNNFCLAGDLSRANVFIFSWVERYFQIKIRVGVDIATCGVDREVLSEIVLVPAEVCFYIPEVRHLNVLCQTTTNNNVSECCYFVHKFELNAVSDTYNSAELSGLFNTFDLKHDVLLKWR